MRVIKEGTLPVKENKCTCYKCKTKFAYIASDVKPDRDGSYIVCPVCGSFIAAEFFN